MTQTTNMATLLEEASNPDQRNADLWAQCFVEADGDESKAKALYVKRKLPAPAAPPPPTHGWCPNCSNKCKLDASECPMCSAKFGPHGWKVSPYKPISKPITESATQVTAKKGGIWKWLIGVPVGGFAVLMIVGSCAGNTPDGKERAASRQSIDYCWSQQSKKSLDLSAARFAASTCERMESDYRAKWGRNP